MNGLYKIELYPMLNDLDSYLKELFDHYGFYESEKMKIKDFKNTLIKDYLDYLDSE